MVGGDGAGEKPAGSDANRDTTPDEAAEEAFPAPAEPTAPDPRAERRRDAALPPMNPREEAEPPQEGSLGT